MLSGCKDGGTEVRWLSLELRVRVREKVLVEMLGAWAVCDRGEVTAPRELGPLFKPLLTALNH